LGTSKIIMDKYRGRRSGEKHEEREEMKQVEKK
jgi:hypothetical protein